MPKHTKKYKIIKDIKTNKLFIDDFGLIRNFEIIIDSFDTSDAAIKAYPSAIILV